jgi:hypothetical protein
MELTIHEVASCNDRTTFKITQPSSSEAVGWASSERIARKHATSRGNALRPCDGSCEVDGCQARPTYDICVQLVTYDRPIQYDNGEVITHRVRLVKAVGATRPDQIVNTGFDCTSCSDAERIQSAMYSALHTVGASVGMDFIDHAVPRRLAP